MALVDNFNNDMAQFADLYGQLLVGELKDLTAQERFATGELMESYKYAFKVVDGRAIINLSASDHLRWADKGRGPGKFPPIQAISEWAAVKGISQDAVFPIARKIAQEGTPASNIIRRSIEAVKAVFIPQFESQLANVVGVRLTNDIFNNTTTQGKIISNKFK